MANTNDSFIDEVAEAVRRERINLWFRRWGWLLGVIVVAIVGGFAFDEWRTSQAVAEAEARGEAILTAAEARDPKERLAALSELPRQGDEGVVAALLLASEQSSEGETEGAAATLNAVASDGSVPPLYRDLAALKAQMALDGKADRAALESLAAPGAPFRLVALEQIALLDLSRNQRDEAIVTLKSIREDAEVTPAQRGRVEALLTALGVPVEEAPAAGAPAPALAGE